MEESQAKHIIKRAEQDALSILMDSDLYLDLPIEERHLLLKHIIEFYRSPSPSQKDC